MAKIPQQLIPLAIIFALVIGAAITARILLVPETFGDYGHYRAAAVDEIAALEMVYAGQTVCNDCHDDIYETKRESNHRGVSCEACHGPALDHVDAPDEITPMAPRGRGYCPLCHGYNPARPSGFPQIVAERHNPGLPCMECHDPHNPLLPHAPEECSACHRDIANAKIVSHHASLECKKCHDVPEGHLSQPKFVRAEKPNSNDMCGNCHAKGSGAARSVPKVDIDEHSERYFCWECHYPHFPEMN